MLLKALAILSLSRCGDSPRNEVERDIWDEIGPEITREHFQYPDLLHHDILLLLSSVIRQHPEPYELIIHDDFRMVSQHTLGLAVDFRLHSYQGMTKCERLDQWYFDFLVLSDSLMILGREDSVGFGIYPDQNNPFFHLDARGSRARWGRIGGSYVGLDYALDWFFRECS